MRVPLKATPQAKRQDLCERNRKVKYFLRLLALASTTACAIFLLGHVLTLLFGYNYKYHRFAPGLVKPRDFLDTGLLAVGFLCSAILYRKLAPSAESVSK
jgi:hypothetical protein